MGLTTTWTVLERGTTKWLSRTKLAKKVLSKREQRHLTVGADITSMAKLRNQVKAMREYREACRERGVTTTCMCYECKWIAEKLGINGGGGVGWEDGYGFAGLIEALQIFSKYGDPQWPTHCEHDTLSICGVGIDKVSKEDLDRLEHLGFKFYEEDECFISYRFGSG